MKKIISWVAGSFFRQAGRFLFYIIIGGLIYVFIQHNDINFKWFNLFGIEQVKADTWKSGTVTWTDENGTVLPQWYGQYRDLYYGASYANIQYRMIGATNVPAGTKGVLYSVVFRQIENSANFVCTDYINTGNSEAVCVKWTSNSAQNMSFVQMYNRESQVFNCYWYDNTFTTILNNTTYIRGLLYCPVTATTDINRLEYNGKVTYYSESNQLNYTYSIGFERTILYDVSDGASIIENQNQNTNTTLEYFGDTNTTSDVNSANSFFTDTNSTSESALQDIVSTPLTLLNNLVNGTYNNLCATLNNKQICLPSGAIIWQRQHGGAGVHDHWFRGGSTEAFITFFNLVVGGFILYKCLISLFNSVHKMLDPTKTYVEVMKL